MIERRLDDGTAFVVKVPHSVAGLHHRLARMGGRGSRDGRPVLLGDGYALLAGGGQRWLARLRVCAQAGRSRRQHIQERP